MTTKTFKYKLVKLLENNGEFVTDVIDMDELKKDAKKQGFDDILYVAGEKEDEVFVLLIQKI